MAAISCGRWCRRSWVGLQLTGLLLGIALGVAVGVVTGWSIIALLALLNLGLVPGLLRTIRAVRRLDAPAQGRGAEPGARLPAVLEHLEAEQGPTTRAVPRLKQARQILDVLDARPLHGAHRAVLATLYAGLPVLALAAGPPWLSRVAGLPGTGIAAPGAEPTPVVVRTHAGSDSQWRRILRTILQPDHASAYRADVRFVDRLGAVALTPDNLDARLGWDYEPSFVFVADRRTFAEQPPTLAVMDLAGDPGLSFRARPADVALIEANVSIGNQSVREFADDVDRDGVFRLAE